MIGTGILAGAVAAHVIAVVALVAAIGIGGPARLPGVLVSVLLITTVWSVVASYRLRPHTSKPPTEIDAERPRVVVLPSCVT